MRKFIITIAVVLAIVGSAPLTTAGATNAEIQAMIAQLMAQLNTNNGGSNSSEADPNAGGSDCLALASTNLRYQSRDASTNNEVSALQDFLNTKGYLRSQPTGYFGLGTVAALKSFQSANGISATGYAGPLTRAKINTLSCVTVGNTTPVVTHPTYPTPPTNNSSRTRPTIYFFTPQTSNTNVGQSNVLSWNVANANRCVIQYGATEETVSAVGSKTVYPSQTTSYRLWCVNEPGDGKDGPSAEQTTSITVLSPNTAGNPIVFITSSNQTTSLTPIISGTATGTNRVGVVLSNSGGKVYGSGMISVVNGRWSVTVSPALVPGAYTLDVYDANNNALVRDALVVNSSVQSLSVYNPKAGDVWNQGNSYTVSWSPASGDFDAYEAKLSNRMVPGTMGGGPTYTQISKYVTSTTFDPRDLSENLVQSWVANSHGVSEQSIRQNFFYTIRAVKNVSSGKDGPAVAEGTSGTFSIVAAVSINPSLIIEQQNPSNNGFFLKASVKGDPQNTKITSYKIDISCTAGIVVQGKFDNNLCGTSVTGGPYYSSTENNLILTSGVLNSSPNGGSITLLLTAYGSGNTVLGTESNLIPVGGDRTAL